MTLQDPVQIELKQALIDFIQSAQLAGAIGDRGDRGSSLDMGHSIYVGSQTPAGGLSSVDVPPIMSLMPNELFGARLAAGKSAVPAETMPMGPGSVAYETAYARGMGLLMATGANAQSVHVVRFDLIQGRQGVSNVIEAMNLSSNNRFFVWVKPQEEAAAKIALEPLGVKYAVADSYTTLKAQLQNVGQRFILTSGLDDLKLTGEFLNDVSSLNKAAIFDKDMVKEATVETVFAASFLAGTRDEAILAIVGVKGESDALKTFLRAGGWAYRILKKPFELLTEIYKMLRQTEVAA